jgi:Reverse transcriptase (RNA-dependent DNA polymerase)
MPTDAKLILFKRVYNVKTQSNGSRDKYKARSLAKGFSQHQGVDYTRTYCPVAKLTTIRSVLGIAAGERLHLAQFDVSTAFLYGT